MRPCMNELQKEYCVKIKLIALDWQWVTLISWCQMNRDGHSFLNMLVKSQLSSSTHFGFRAIQSFRWLCFYWNTLYCSLWFEGEYVIMAAQSSAMFSQRGVSVLASEIFAKALIYTCVQLHRLSNPNIPEQYFFPWLPKGGGIMHTPY